MRLLWKGVKITLLSLLELPLTQPNQPANWNARTMSQQGSFAEPTVSKFQETLDYTTFERDDYAQLPWVMVYLAIAGGQENRATFDLMREAAEAYDQPGDTSSFAFQLARQISTETLIETTTPEDREVVNRSEQLMNFIGEELIREAQTTTNLETFLELAQFFAMKDMDAIWSDRHATQLLTAMVDNPVIAEQHPLEYHTIVGVAFQAYVMMFPTREILENRLTVEYPNLRSIADAQSAEKRTETLEWLKKHTQIIEAQLRSGEDPFRDQCRYALQLEPAQIEALVQLRTKVGTIVPPAFEEAKGNVWGFAQSNSELEEIGNDVVKILKGV